MAPNPMNLWFGAIDGPKPYGFIGVGATDGPEPYDSIGFGAIGGPKTKDLQTPRRTTEAAQKTTGVDPRRPRPLEWWGGGHPGGPPGVIAGSSENILCVVPYSVAVITGS